jgi:CelD/BcsL family acetyltransferase involved in cellulose biosynthesis
MAYELHVAETLAELDRLMPEWEALLPRAAAHRFYQAPLVVRSRVVDASRRMTPFVVTGRRDGRLVFVAPFCLRRRRFPIALSVVHVSGPPVRQIKLLGDQIVRAADEPADTCLSATFRALADNRDAFDLIEIESLRMPSELWTFFENGGGAPFRLVPASDRPQKVHWLELAKNFDAYLAAMNGKTRMKFRRRVKKFSADHKEQVELRKYVRPEDVATYLAIVDDVYPRSWQAHVSGGYKRGQPWERTFNEEVARRGWLRAYALFVEGRAVAFLTGYQYAGVFHHDETGYDRDMVREGPGSVLNNLVVEDLHKVDRPNVLDFGFGENEYKRILGNADQDACAAWITKPGAWRAAITAQGGVTRLYERVRAELVKRHLDARVRNFIKRKRGDAPVASGPAVAASDDEGPG